MLGSVLEKEPQISQKRRSSLRGSENVKKSYTRAFQSLKLHSTVRDASPYFFCVNPSTDIHEMNSLEKRLDGVFKFIFSIFSDRKKNCDDFF